MSVYRIGTADTFTGQYRDRAAFIEGILGRLAIEARERNWQGTRLHEANWHPGADAGADMAFIAVEPGDGHVTVGEVRMYLVERKRREKKQRQQEEMEL